MKGINLKQIDNIYFVGAGGIGMSALARYFLSLNKNVAGYDRKESDLTQKLNSQGANIHYEDNVRLIPENFKSSDSTLVIYTPAVPESHTELSFFRANSFQIMKRAEVLGLITNHSKGLCIAGTHGKTTTSSMLAHLLKQSKVDCNAFLGGILKPYDSNLMLSDTSDFTVIEADEYDRSFLHLTPYMAVITSADPDHLDIYHSPEDYTKSFELFTSLIRPEGLLLMKKGLNIHPQLQKGVALFTYSSTEEADYYATNILTDNGQLLFDFVYPEGRINRLSLGVPVLINVENAVAAIAIALKAGATEEEVRKGIDSYQGPKRRFDIQLKTDNIVLIDDYAHHPAEIRASIQSVKELYKDRKLTVVFQPHLFSRTKDFHTEFAESLSLADELLLLDIYPARELPIEGITSQLILDQVKAPSKRLVSKEELLQVLSSEPSEVVLTMGAGDISELVTPIKNTLIHRGS